MFKFTVALVAAFLLAGCGQSLYMQGRQAADSGEYQKAVDRYYDKLKEDPEDARSWRELGVAYYELGNDDKSLEALQRANEIQPDARTLLFIGMAHGRKKQWKLSAEAYDRALELSPPEKLVEVVQTRLSRIQTRQEIDKALANEQSLSLDSIPHNTVAVYDFDGSTLDPAMAPIAIGLAEFTAVDLAKVKSLRVVERRKLQALLQELALAQTGAVDPATAPRVGKLLGTRNIVTGAVFSTEEDKLSLQGAVVSTVDLSELYPEVSEAKLKKIFEMQKAFVFDVLNKLGIELTAEERDAIRKIPTESYLAFLAYCKGLEYQRQGNFQQAKQEFEIAADLDVGFVEAEVQVETTVAMESESQFETVVQTQTLAGGSSELETTLTTTLGDLGGINAPDEVTGGEGEAETSGENEDSGQPPQVQTGSVTVKGDLDG